jgi:hypothetical protein
MILFEHDKNNCSGLNQINYRGGYFYEEKDY